MKKKLREILKHVPGVKAAYLLACRLFLNRWRMRKIFRYDQGRFLKHSPNSRHRTKEGALASIIMTYHVVEKGLTMPERRLGFGREMLLGLIVSLNEFADKYGTREPQFVEAVRVVAEYKNFTMMRILHSTRNVPTQLKRCSNAFPSSLRNKSK